MSLDQNIMTCIEKLSPKMRYFLYDKDPRFRKYIENTFDYCIVHTSERIAKERYTELFVFDLIREPNDFQALLMLSFRRTRM